MIGVVIALIIIIPLITILEGIFESDKPKKGESE